MLVEWLSALEQLPFVAELRNSRWTYATVNASHIVGIALLFGAIVPLDLRLMGCWRSVPIQTLARILVPVAAAGWRWRSQPASCCLRPAPANTPR